MAALGYSYIISYFKRADVFKKVVKTIMIVQEKWNALKKFALKFCIVRMIRIVMQKWFAKMKFAHLIVLQNVKKTRIAQKYVYLYL